MKKSIRYIFITAILISVAGIATAIYMYTLRNKNLEKVKPDFFITASALAEEFIKDEASASAKYIGKVLEITGIIKELNAGENNTANVELSSDSDFSYVICNFPDNKAVAGFETGKEITVRGECAGFLLDVFMTNCAVVSKRDNK